MFAISNPALYDAMFTLATLPFGQPERPAAMREGFAALRQAVAPVAGDRDVDILTQLTWSALHGLAVLTRARRLSDGADEARLTMLTEVLTCSPQPRARAAADPGGPPITTCTDAGLSCSIAA